MKRRKRSANSESEDSEEGVSEKRVCRNGDKEQSGHVIVPALLRGGHDPKNQDHDILDSDSILNPTLCDLVPGKGIPILYFNHSS